MADNPNDHKVDGVLYAKHIRTWENKAKGTHGEFQYYILEIPTPKRWTTEEGKEQSVTKKELVKFMLPRGFYTDTFEIADPITIEFTLSGKEYAKKDNSGKDYFLELNATSIKFTDVNRKHIHKNDPFAVDTPTEGPQNNPDDLPF